MTAANGSALPSELSDTAHEIFATGVSGYERLVVTGEGLPAGSRLQSLGVDQLFRRPVTNADEAKAVMAGLWLWFDWLDTSHTIAQGIDTPTGRYWHAIMHRREGDFWNSKYWLARCAVHPAQETIAQAIEDDPAVNAALEGLSGRDDPLVAGVIDGRWNAAKLVDLAQAVHDHPADPRHAIAVAIQRVEWFNLMRHCAAAAVA